MKKTERQIVTLRLKRVKSLSQARLAMSLVLLYYYSQLAICLCIGDYIRGVMRSKAFLNVMKDADNELKINPEEFLIAR